MRPCGTRVVSLRWCGFFFSGFFCFILYIYLFSYLFLVCMKGLTGRWCRCLNQRPAAHGSRATLRPMQESEPQHGLWSSLARRCSMPSQALVRLARNVLADTLCYRCCEPLG